MADENAATETQEAPAPSSRRKLLKSIDDTAVVINVLGGSRGEVQYDFLELPDEIQEKLGPFGLNHKLGDAAAGKSGAEAEEAIQRVWEGLKSGDWSVRAPAAPKVSLKAVSDNYSNLDDSEKEAAKELLKSLGMKIPGITE